MSPTRTRPLSVDDDLGLHVESSDADPQAHHDRDERFDEGVRNLRIGRAGGGISDRWLLIVGGILAPVGIVVVIIGWYGAAHTAYEFEQLPYVISGGLLGLGLVLIGCFLYFAYWLTQLVKEHREQSAAILAALERLANPDRDHP
jgi:hypothetical protein